MASRNIDPGWLSGMPLFRRIPARELERLASVLHERVFPVGANILTAEQPGEAVYVLLKGSVKVHLLMPGVAESTILARNLAEILSKRLRMTNANLLAMATLDVPGWVALPADRRVCRACLPRVTSG